MKTYTVNYSGNSTRFQKFETEINANSEREAVEQVYANVMDENYFPQENGSILDCDGKLPGNIMISIHADPFRRQTAVRYLWFRAVRKYAV
jgi:hypothetical protein